MSRRDRTPGRWARRRRAGVRRSSLALLAALAAPSLLAGQTIEELVQRLDSLQPLLERAERDVDRAALERRRRAREELGIALDTIRVGPLRIVTPEEQVPDARRAFQEVWERTAPLVGDATGALSGTIWVFQHAPRLHRLHVLLIETGDTDVRHVRVSSWHPWERVVGAVEASVWATLAGGLRGEVRNLVTAGPWRLEEPGLLELAYRELVTATGRPARACVDGEIEACWTAMGADGPPERWEEWYGPAERRALALRSRPTGDAGLARRLRTCERGKQAACDRILSDLQDPVVPVTGMARSGFVGFALELGGAGGWERLAQAGGSDLREAIARAAGLDADEVMRRWRSRILEHRPEIGAGTARTGGSTLLWIAVLGTLAMGSTRWRLG